MGIWPTIKRAKKVENILISCFVLLICFGGLEITLRLTSENETYPLVEVKINQQGFRERPLDQITKDSPKTLVIGDSFCFGQGVRRQDRFSDILAKQLNQHLVNLCLPAEAIDGIDEILKNHLPLFPHVQRVLYAFTLNDPIWDEAIGSPDKFISDFMQLREENWSHHSYALRWILRRFQNAKQTKMAEEWYQKLYDNDSGWPRTKNFLIEINQLARSKDSELVLVIFPLFHKLKQYPFRNIHEKLKDFCRANGIKYLDLLPIFEGEDEEKLWVHPTDFHPNHIAHQRAADFLASAISW